MTEPTNHTLLQGLLRSGITVAEVIEKYHLKVSRSVRHPNLVQFKYDQIESDLSDPLVQQCRGIILDEDDHWSIIARPFDKFFNAGESEAAKIDWSTASVVEKLDGSCCILYYYQGWHVATLGSCDASGGVLGFDDMTFKDLFWQVFHDLGYQVPDDMWIGVTFVFELTTPYNRVVVPHATSNLHLLGTRIASGEESSINDAGYAIPKTFGYNNLSEIEGSFDQLNPLKTEGYVVVDGRYHRIKVKHPGYVRIHHIKESFTLRNVVELIRKGEDTEFVTYFPEHARLLNIIRKSFFDLVRRITEDWLAHYNIEPIKAFALKVKDLPYSGVLFALKRGQIENVVMGLQKAHIDDVIKLMQVDKETLH